MWYLQTTLYGALMTAFVALLYAACHGEYTVDNKGKIQLPFERVQRYMCMKRMFSVMHVLLAALVFGSFIGAGLAVDSDETRRILHLIACNYLPSAGGLVVLQGVLFWDYEGARDVDGKRKVEDDRQHMGNEDLPPILV